MISQCNHIQVMKIVCRRKRHMVRNTPHIAVIDLWIFSCSSWAAWHVMVTMIRRKMESTSAMLFSQLQTV